MKFLRALLMLGPFILLGALAIVLIGLSVASVYFANITFDEVYTLIERRSHYQRAEAEMLEMQVLARKAIMVGFYSDPSEQAPLIEQKEASMGRIEEVLDELTFLEPDEEQLAADNTLRENRDTLGANFDSVQELIDDPQVAYDLSYELALDEVELIEWQRDQVQVINRDLTEAIQDMNFIKGVLIWIVLGVLMLFPLLAVIGFLLDSRYTQPLLQIDNAVMSVGGGHYQPEMIDEAMRRRDSLGRLAKQVNGMAKALDARDAALNQEVGTLRQQLHDLRRQKLSTSVDIDMRELIGGSRVE